MKKTAVIEFFVSPHGNDRWSGKRQRPFATIARAQQAVRKLKRRGELKAPVRVVLRGGRHELRRPLQFTAADSGVPAKLGEWHRVAQPELPVTYAAYPGERPVISGGRRITGWRKTTVNGVPAWVARCRGQFTQLWVNDRRAVRPRLPRKGYFRIEKVLGAVPTRGSIHKQLFTGQDRFRFAPGDLQAWRNVSDIEFVALHFWIESRIPFASINPRTREARLQWKSRMRLKDDFGDHGAQYYVENIFEELREPGQWYHDRVRGELYYIPRPGETIATSTVIAPRLAQLAHFRDVQHLVLEGLTFSHNEWLPGDEKFTATPQAACHIPGAVTFHNARQCLVRDCVFTHLGSYALELAGGSQDVDVVGNHISDLAAGGVKVWHDAPARAKAKSGGSGPDMEHGGSCRRIRIMDNEIADGGHRWRQAVGVLIGKCSGNQVLHNHIHDFDYSGISVGWTWGYAESYGWANIIEHNHIHHIGRGVLSDMGAIYLLGTAPGTRVRFNHIHDVDSRGYGGWGIYLDEGSSHVLVENNLVYRTKSEGYHQHYGRENIVCNNIFALGREGQFKISRVEPHLSATLARNIFLSDNGGKVVAGKWGGQRVKLDTNLYFDLGRQPLQFGEQSFRRWQKLGADRRSRVADPKFRNPRRGDFRLPPNSPALKIGFRPFTLSAGPRAAGKPRAAGRSASGTHG